MKQENIILDKSKRFALRIIKLYKYMISEHKEYVLSKQILRSGTSVGANVREAVRGQSTADFYAKFNIALKEAEETLYWLELLHRTNYIDGQRYKILSDKCTTLRVMLVSSCRTAKANIDNK